MPKTTADQLIEKAFWLLCTSIFALFTTVGGCYGRDFVRNGELVIETNMKMQNALARIEKLEQEQAAGKLRGNARDIRDEKFEARLDALERESAKQNKTERGFRWNR